MKTTNILYNNQYSLIDKGGRRLTAFALFVILHTLAFAQWECPSRVAANLNQVGGSPLSWGFEQTNGIGSLDENEIFNNMTYLGLDCSVPHHTFYGEGGYKYWWKQDNALEVNIENHRFGLRDLYYKYTHNTWHTTLGLQAMNAGDNYLLNERLIGLNITGRVKSFDLHFYGGSVVNKFSRSGAFCDMGYIYDILPIENQPIVGKSFGETNLAGMEIAYLPGSSSGGADDGLGFSDEFAEPAFISLDRIALVYYTEFGSDIDQKLNIPGLYVDISVKEHFMLRPEVLYQSEKDNCAVFYNIKASGYVDWNEKHNSSISASYFGMKEVDKYAEADNRFSNIFAGTVFRLDSPDMPFVQCALKHKMPSQKIHGKLQFTAQTTGYNAKEFDAEFGKRLFNGNLALNFQYSYMMHSLLSNNPNMFRLELRFNMPGF